MNLLFLFDCVCNFLYIKESAFRLTQYALEPVEETDMVLINLDGCADQFSCQAIWDCR